ncbi:MAG: hypothetical protein R2684_10495 [Pyrinomonadaceae bacterium]
MVTSTAKLNENTEVKSYDSEVFERIRYYESLNEELKLEAQHRQRSKYALSPQANTISLSRAMQFLGLLCAALPGAAIILRISMDSGPGLLLFIFAAGVLLSSFIGYKTAPYFSRMVAKVSEETSHWVKIPLFAGVGGLWGLISGGIGGLPIFGIGSVFGGAIGAIVGAISLAVFGVGYELTGDSRQLRTAHFLPLVVGPTLAIAAFVLGL